MKMNQTGRYELCIIVPVFNEEDNMVSLSRALAAYIEHASVATCVMFINDGSVDKSLEKIEASCREYPDMFFLGFARNCGLSAALKAGFDWADSPFCGYIDADLQTSPDDFELLLPYRREYELITGIRTGRKDSFAKRMSSKIANSFRRMMTHDGIEDTGCPLKIIRTDTAKRMPFFKGMHRFMPALVLLQEGKIRQIPVRHFERTAGKSKFHLWNRLTGPFIDCFAYRWMKKRYIRYSIETSNVERV